MMLRAPFDMLLLLDNHQGKARLPDYSLELGVPSFNDSPEFLRRWFSVFERNKERWETERWRRS
jgi:hypothetical protein